MRRLIRLGRRLWVWHDQVITAAGWMILLSILYGVCLASAKVWVDRVDRVAEVVDFVSHHGFGLGLATVVLGGVILAGGARLGVPIGCVLDYAVEVLRIAPTIAEHERRREVLPLVLPFVALAVAGRSPALSWYLAAVEAALLIESAARKAGAPPAPWGFRWAYVAAFCLAEAALASVRATWVVDYIVPVACWVIVLAGALGRWMRRWLNHGDPDGMPSGAGKEGAGCSGSSGTGGCGADRGPGRAVPTHSPGFARAGPGRRSAPIAGAGWAGAVATEAGGGGSGRLRRLYFTPLPAGRR